MDQLQLSADVNARVNLVKSIANKTRGPYAPDKYGNVIIPMAIIRRLDCVLAARNSEIADLLNKLGKSRVDGVQLEKAVSKQFGIPFYNSKCVSLEQLIGDSDNLDANFLEFISAYSPSVQIILRDLKFREEVEFMIKKGILFEVVKAFSEVDFHPDTTSPIAMGYIFEEIIRTYKANAEAGDHYTPREVIELCVDLMMSENVDGINKEGRIVRVYDGCCGTGGMLTALKRKIGEISGNGVNVRLYGQEVNPEAYAICCAAMLMLGEESKNIREGNTLSEDRFAGEKFDLLISIPPFGVEWKSEKSTVEKELLSANNRFVAGTPRVSDGQLLFLQNLLAKAEDDARIAIILNGSPLFSGDAGSGESEIRRYVIENHLLEAIVGLPDQMFYNTSIFSYIWIISKKPNKKRARSIQLIDATGFYIDQKPKSPGNKRKFIDPGNRDKIVALYKAFEGNDYSKIFAANDFGYTRVTLERPLYDHNGQVVIKKGKAQVDTAQRDTENIPLKRDIDEYIKTEVLPYLPDAFADRSKDKIGYEIPFTRYFYKYVPPRPSREIMSEIIAAEKSIEDILAAFVAENGVIYKAATKGLDQASQLKEINVPLIGKYPEKWKVVKLKNTGSYRSGESISASLISEDGQYPVFGGNGLRGYTENKTHEDDSVLIGRQGALCGNVHFVKGQFWASENAVVCNINKDYDAKFMYHLLSSTNLNQCSESAAQQGISLERVANLSVSIPSSKNDQMKIAAYLDDKCGQIDAVITANESIVKKLREYRQSLIYEAVTGKIACN